MRWLRGWAWWLLSRFRQPTIQPQALACTHRWPDGTSAWTPCNSGGYTVCLRCKAKRAC